MKQVGLIPLALFAAALVGYGALTLLHIRPFPHEMALAIAPSLVAGVVALLPALRQRIYGQAAVVQGAFLGMILHMVATLLLSIFIYFAADLHRPAMQPFALWVVWFFWVSLMAVASALIRVIRLTPIAPSHGPV